MTGLLALKNIVRNKKNSLVITLLIAVIGFLFFTGNSLLAKTGTGLKRSYTESLTGDLVIQKRGDVTMNLFGANAPIVDNYFSIPVLPAYDTLRGLLRDIPEIESSAGQISTNALMEYGGERFPVPVCGVDGGEYFPLFPGITLEEGRFLQTGETGVMLTQDARQTYQRAAGIPLDIGSPLTFLAAGKTGFKIREAPLTGVFSYQSPGRFMNSIVIADAQSVRALAEIQVASAGVAVSAAAVSLLDAGEDTLFWAGFEEGAALLAADSAEDTAEEEAALARAGGGGDRNFIIARLKPGARADAVIAKLNRLLEPYGARAVSWRLAAGGSAIISLMLSALFNGGIVLVSVAGIIAVVNIMLIAVFRRTREIGTLRAIGAGSAYIRLLVLAENALLGLAAGIIAALSGALFLRLVNAADITLSNEFLANLAGGARLRLDFSPPLALATIAVSLAVSALSSLYPVEMAVRIEPSVAQRQG